MTEKLEIYKCHVCGNLVQVLISGIGELVCCGQAMEHLIPKCEENNELAEKHIPVFENKDGKRIVTLTHHPMTDEHYIQLIEVISKDKSAFSVKYLHPNEIAQFDITELEGEYDAVEHCNIHGLWRSKND